jgi:hypothetical protein
MKRFHRGVTADNHPPPGRPSGRVFLAVAGLSRSVLARSFSIVVVLSFPGLASTAQATPFYLVNTVNFYGNSYYTDQTAGNRFTPTSDLSVFSLGIFDYGLDGMGESHQVGIFDSGGTLLTSAAVGAGTIGRLDGEFRYTDIAPLRLTAGNMYTIAALFMTQADRIGYADVSDLAIDGHISVDSDPSRYHRPSGGVLAYPDMTAARSAPFYVTANFEFEEASSSVPDAGSSLFLFGIGLAGLRVWRTKQ